MVLKSKRKVVSIPPPSITIFARHKKIDWKSRAAEISTTKDILRHQCNHSLNAGLVECIKEKTFDLKETIKDAYLWYSAKETTSLMEPTFWSSCSLEYLALAFEHGMDYCLRNKPAALFDGPVCGNGFVEQVRATG